MFDLAVVLSLVALMSGFSPAPDHAPEADSVRWAALEAAMSAVPRWTA